MFDGCKKYIWSFFAGIATAAIAWSAMISGRRRPTESKTEVKLNKAQAEEEQIKRPPTPKSLKEQEDFLRKNGYLK